MKDFVLLAVVTTGGIDIVSKEEFKGMGLRLHRKEQRSQVRGS
jgi:hypothetical protein